MVLQRSDLKVAEIENAHLPEYGEGEHEAVQTVRRMLAEAGETQEMSDMMVLRFVRGRKGDVDKAFRLLQRHCDWRREKSADTITLDACPDEAPKKRVVIQGTDQQGRPGLYCFAVRYAVLAALI